LRVKGFIVGLSKNIKKLKKILKNNRKNQTVKKPIKILKKLTGSVRFWFYKPETEKTESNPN
jgi:hypothetical protein